MIAAVMRKIELVGNGRLNTIMRDNFIIICAHVSEMRYAS